MKSLCAARKGAIASMLALERTEVNGGLCIVSMKRLFLIHCYKVSMNVLWHVKSLKLKSKVKQTIALLLSILHITLVQTYWLSNLVKFFFLPHSMDGDESFIVPMKVAGHIYRWSIPCYFAVLCVMLPKMQKMAKKMCYFLQSAYNSPAGFGDVVVFVLIFIIWIWKFAFFSSYTIKCAFLSLEAFTLAIIGYILPIFIEYTVDITLIILTLYCNFMSDVVSDEVCHILSLIPQQPGSFNPPKPRTTKSLKITSNKSLNFHSNSKLDVKIEQVSSYYHHEFVQTTKLKLVHLSLLLDELFSQTNWLVFFMIVRNTAWLITTIFSVISKYKGITTDTSIFLMADSSTMVLILLNISERLTRKVSELKFCFGVLLIQDL